MVTATSPTSLSQALRLTPRPYQYEAVAALLAATARGVQRPLLVWARSHFPGQQVKREECRS
jgi:hypothetical protein